MQERIHNNIYEKEIHVDFFLNIHLKIISIFD